eukprot:COSAG06_NODE_417_length_15986_cov_832.025493_4_plen_139_part_00
MLRENSARFECLSYVCLEPIWVKWSFLYRQWANEEARAYLGWGEALRAARERKRRRRSASSASASTAATSTSATTSSSSSAAFAGRCGLFEQRVRSEPRAAVAPRRLRRRHPHQVHVLQALGGLRAGTRPRQRAADVH